MTIHDSHALADSSSVVAALMEARHLHTSRSSLCSSSKFKKSQSGISTNQPTKRVMVLSSMEGLCREKQSTMIYSENSPATSSLHARFLSSCKRSECPSDVQSFQKTHVPSRSFADRSECPSDVQSFQKTHVPPSSFADSVSNPQYFSTSVPSPGGAPSPPAYRSDFSPTISSATSDDPSTASFPTLNSSFSKIHFAVLSNDSFASTISSGPSTSVDSSSLFRLQDEHATTGGTLRAPSSASLTTMLHLGELESVTMFSGGTFTPQYGLKKEFV